MARKCHIGIIGLGVMGRNLALNIAERGFAVVGFDSDAQKVQALRHEGREHDVRGAETLADFIAALRKPRAALMLVPAGKPVDAVIRELSRRFDKGDLIIDAGNSHFTDTNRRAEALDRKGLLFLGIGVSGGEYGARHGPSIMPAGHAKAYTRVRDMLEAASAKVDGQPCVAYLGDGSAGHYVKMVHNGIEYGIMQLLAESYDLMRRGLGFDNDRLADVYGQWSRGRLNGFLVEITAQIFTRPDDRSPARLIDVILDEAAQKGTGKWTSQDAMELQVPACNIDVAVAMRDMSAPKALRQQAARQLTGPYPRYAGNADEMIDRIEQAMVAAVFITYGQGMALLARAREQYGYTCDLAEVARIWRGGCIIRAALLEDIRCAYASNPSLANLLLDHVVGRIVLACQDSLRLVVQTAAGLGIPAPGLMAALGYYDSLRSARCPANLLQAQRDFFGSHTYRRTDADGVFHTDWDRARIG